MSKRLLRGTLIPATITIICFLLCCLSATVESSSGTEDASTSSLDAQYKDKLVMLRSLSCGQKLKFDAAGKLVSGDEAGRKPCQGMRVRHIYLDHGSLKIKAQLVRLVYDCAREQYREATESTSKSGEPARGAKESNQSQEILIEVQLPPRADNATIMGSMDRLFHISLPGPYEAISAPASEIANPGSNYGFDGRLFHVGNGVSAPVPVFSPDPEYSPEARDEGYQGTVVLTVIVGPDGRVHNPRVIRAVGQGLDEKAVEKVMTWRFKPATKCGNPVAVEVRIEVEFKL